MALNHPWCAFQPRHPWRVVRRMRRTLVGETFMRAADPGEKLAELFAA